ncbi:outer membrane biosynthesis protein TonB [Priestia megaterium]
MKMLKVAFGIPLLAILLAACSEESSETVSQKEEPTEKSTAVHTKENGNKTAVKESSPNTLQTKASTIKKAVNSKEADRDYLLNIMNGYQYIQVGDNQYIYYGINQEQNVFCMMEVNFDASGDYVENINFVDNASEEQIALLQNQIQEQQKQLSDFEQQQMEKELDDYYAQLEEDRQKEEEAQAKADAEAEAQAEADRKAQEERLAEEEKKQQEEEEAQAKADEEEAQADSEDEVQTESESEPEQEEDTEAIEEEEPAEQTVSQEQAIQLVRDQQGISEDSPLLVTYDHVDDSGNYIIHVYENVVDNEETGEEHTATQGWYQVSPSDGSITDVTVDGY